MGLKMEDDLCGPLLCAAGFEQGLFMVYANNDKSVCQFLPPLIIQEDEARWVLERLDLALGAVAGMKAGM